MALIHFDSVMHVNDESHYNDGDHHDPNNINEHSINDCGNDTYQRMVDQSVSNKTLLMKHRIVRPMSSKSFSRFFLSRTTTTLMFMVMMTMLSSTISSSLDIVQEPTISTIGKWNEQEDQQDGMNHLNDMMTKHVA